jgi:hypothetical protein
MALVHCILDKILVLVCHCFPLVLNIPTFAVRCPHFHNGARDTNSERWNYELELATLYLGEFMQFHENVIHYVYDD